MSQPAVYELPHAQTSLPCAADGCLGNGEHHPVLVLRCKAISKRDVTTRAVMRFALCNVHRQLAVVDNFLTDTNWNQILGAFVQAKRLRPKRNLTTLDFCDVGSAEADNFLRR